MAHLYCPRDVVPQSVMPAYRWLMRNPLKVDDLPARLATLRGLGVPYTDEQIENAAQDALGQADPDNARFDGVYERYGEETNVRYFDGERGYPTEMDAIVAYLQVLGQLTDVQPALEPEE